MKIKGFRGNGRADKACVITEGEGIYISRTIEFARVFGPEIEVVEYFEPENPLVVHNEPLYLLEDDFQLFAPIRENDSVWTRLNKQAAEGQSHKSSRDYCQSMFTPEAGDYVAKELTKLIREAGYDAVRIIFEKLTIEGNPTCWDVLLNPDLVIKRHPLKTALIDISALEMEYCGQPWGSNYLA